MQITWGQILITALSVVVTLVVTLIFNKLVALPTAVKKQKEAQQRVLDTQQETINEQQTVIETMKTEQEALKEQLASLKSAVDALPGYRQQSLNIQTELKRADDNIMNLCIALKDALTANTNELKEGMQKLQQGQDAARNSLKRLEKREKNSLRLKIITEYKLFVNEYKNPEKAWSEMEQHAFMALVKDYEALGGNDYVHNTVLPEINELEIVLMEDTERLAEVMSARRV